MSNRVFRGTLALLLTLAAAPAVAQTVGTPTVAPRADTAAAVRALVVPPAIYDSIRSSGTVCSQVRVAGVTRKAVCRSKTGVWERRLLLPPPPTVSLTLAIEGDPATGAWAVRADPVGFTPARVAFSVDGLAYSSEGVPAYCLFGGDGPCTLNTLTAGAHVIQVTAVDAAGAVLATASLTVTQGTGDTSLNIVRILMKPDGGGLVGVPLVRCPFLVFADGAVAERDQDRPGCDLHYTLLLPKLPTLAQQAVANQFCIKWQVPVGMTITVSGCDTIAIAS